MDERHRRAEPTALGKFLSADPEVIRALSDCQRVTVLSDEEVRRERASRIRSDRREQLESSGISERLDAESILAIVNDALRPTKALELIGPWLKSSRPVLALFGDVGQGKTVAAGWALTRRLGRYVTEQGLCEMRKSWQERDRFERLMTTGLLVIDELGRARDAAEALQLLMDVIDRRQRAPRRTLLLGNLDANQLCGRYDRATLDRLGIDGDDSGIAVVRYLRGPSLRRAAVR